MKIWKVTLGTDGTIFDWKTVEARNAIEAIRKVDRLAKKAFYSTRQRQVKAVELIAETEP